jgi:hypothetical protein
MRLGCIAVLVGGYLLWSGGQGLYTSAKNREPFSVSCQSYPQVKPSQEWLELTGCSLSLLEASYTETSGSVTELFIPARGEAEEEGSTIHILVATKDAELLGLANQLLKIEDQGEMMQFSLEHRDKIFPTRNVSGLVRYGVDLDDDERAELKGLDDTLTEDFVILDEGKEPGLGRSLGMFGGGVVIVLVTGGALIGSSSKS